MERRPRKLRERSLQGAGEPMTDNQAPHACPKCRGHDIERVPKKRVLDRMARVLGLRVYRCRDCGTRFYDRPAERQAS